MTIARFFNKTFIIRDLHDTGGIKEQLTATGTIEGHYQRLDEHTDSIEFSVYGATHKLWCDINTKIKKQDDIEDEDGHHYTVVAVIKKEPDVALNEHLEVLLRIYNDE